jgi:sporulation protein YlmC with PRC-barrel domain
MRNFFIGAASVALLALSTQGALAASPPAQTLTSMPSDSVTVTDWYKQDVYDTANNKIGDIKDVLVDRDGKVAALIIGVGGFLGAGEKDVAVPFSAIQMTTKNNNSKYLVMNATKDDLKNAPGYTYDRTSTMWVPEKKS